MRWYRELTRSQQRILLGLTAGVIVVVGLLSWSVWSTLKAQPAQSPPPTPISPLSVLPSPTPKPTPTNTPTPRPTPTPRFDIGQAGLIADAVADARGLVPRWNTPLTLVNAGELTTILTQHHDESPPLPLDTRATLKALRLWFWDDEDVRIAPYTQGLRAGALYVPEAEELYLRRDWYNTADVLQTQIAYGYARALPDQHGELPQLIADATTFDRRLALTAVGDGDALLALWRYSGVEPGAKDAQALADTVADAILPGWQPNDPLLRDLSRLSLDLGATFAADLYAEGGLDALDAALQRPPRSTEQLLHIDRYLGDDEPIVLTPVEPTLARGWTLAQTDTLGEAMLRLALLEWSNGDIAPDNLPNWGGDLFQVWTGPEDDAGHTADVILWQTVWESSRDAGTFYGQLREILPRPLLPGLIRDTTAAASLPYGRWWAGRQGAIFLHRTANRICLVWGSDPEAVEAIGAAINP